MFSKNTIFHQFPTSKNHKQSQKKLSKVSPRDLIFLSHFLSITLGSQSAPPDLHYEPSGIDFGPQIEYKNKNRIETSRIFSKNTFRMPASNRRVPKWGAAVTRRMASSIYGTLCNNKHVDLRKK